MIIKTTLFLQDGGNVGIGAVSPDEKLEVDGHVKATGFIGDGSLLTGIPVSPWENVNDGIGYASGNVGIGDTTAPSRLTLYGTTAEGWNSGIELNREDGGQAQMVVDENGMNFRTPVDGDGFYFRDNDNQTTLFLQDGGNVGIGTNSPNAGLHVVANGPQVTIEPKDASGQDAVVKIKGHRNTLTTVDQAQLIFQNSDNQLADDTNSLGMISGKVTDHMDNVGDLVFYNFPDGNTQSETMRLTRNGNVGIGTDANHPIDTAFKLSVNGEVRATGFIGDGSQLTGIQGLSQWEDVNGGINYNSSVGIGTDANHPIDTTFKLSVNGEVRAIAITVESDWADYVFDESYSLRPLEEVARFIGKNKHLPDMPSAQTIRDQGLDLGDMQTKMMAKIEELTLYLIEMERENDALKTKMEGLEKQVKNHKSKK